MARGTSDRPRPRLAAGELLQQYVLTVALLLLAYWSGEVGAASGAGGSHSSAVPGGGRSRLHFPLPASAAACPSFARYTRLHRAALGQLDQLPGLVSGYNARQHGAGAVLEGPRYTHSHRHASGTAATRPLATGAGTGHHRDRQLATAGSAAAAATAAAASDAATGSEGSTNPTAATPTSLSAPSSSSSSSSSYQQQQPRSKARWLVTLDPDGIADRLVNAVSSFYFALLTDRVLCVLPAYDHGYQPGLEAAFTPGPNIDWTCGRQPSAAELERRQEQAQEQPQEQAQKQGEQGEGEEGEQAQEGSGSGAGGKRTTAAGKASKAGKAAAVAADSGPKEAGDAGEGAVRRLASTGRLLLQQQQQQQRGRRVLADEVAGEDAQAADSVEEEEEEQAEEAQAADGQGQAVSEDEEEEAAQQEEEEAAAEPPGLDPAPLPPLVDTSDVAYWNPTADDAWMDPGFPIYTQFVRSHLDRIGPYNATTLVLRMHRGISVALFNNPHHRRQMEGMGLRPDTAFGCAMAYLFGSLNAATRALAAAEPRLHGIMTDESAIKIGIQIRLGDAKILAQLQGDNQTAALDDEARKVVDGFLNCAATLAASVTGLSGPEGPQPETGHQAAGDRVAPGDVAGLQQLLAHGGTEYDHFRQQQEQQQQQQQQQVEGGATAAPPPLRPAAPPAGPPLRIYYYLMTDTLAVRQVALERFGDALLFPPQSTVEFYQHVTDDGLRRTVLEHWYFSRCHHHVITGHSGMGRTAAFGSLRPGPRLYSMEIADGTRMAGRGCELWEADRPMDVYNTWSGV
ncbi:hypothetical protein CHLRE_02g109000v5 [Chlamydomonas reinhardtii]|uniref:RING-type E3 ubiquitin transferase n=1 Tax=Chlamydomonas reinhardtii TaxID=3055 RepID=A0A2K3E2S4_CHLRE|nr:uncharacterized protein CHLRE_02g109000v5 [Chlamydomonas reinhardtii]PNW87099.1 hypothetical protein CHLRE_02g109000v5 [Chlamydomonas reinhardtii]